MESPISEILAFVFGGAFTYIVLKMTDKLKK